MDAYTGFAYVYDSFMADIPYDDWAEYTQALLSEYEINSDCKAILELGCGTGEIAQRMARKGFSMIGIDCSTDMLSVATDKMYESQLQIMYSNQDMREFALPHKVSAIISICDSMNYITQSQDLKKVFECVVKYLDKSGVFIFDMKTKYFYREILGSKTFADNRENCSYIWENYYDEENCINEYDLTIFNKEVFDKEASDKEDEGLYRKYEEYHKQKAYDIEEVKNIAEEAGLEVLQVYEACTHELPTDQSERVYFVLKVKTGINIFSRLFRKHD